MQLRKTEDGSNIHVRVYAVVHACRIYTLYQYISWNLINLNLAAYAIFRFRPPAWSWSNCLIWINQFSLKVMICIKKNYRTKMQSRLATYTTQANQVEWGKTNYSLSKVMNNFFKVITQLNFTKSDRTGPRTHAYSVIIRSILIPTCQLWSLWTTKTWSTHFRCSHRRRRRRRHMTDAIEELYK